MNMVVQQPALPIHSHRIIKAGKDLSDPQVQPQPTPHAHIPQCPTALNTSMEGDPTTPWAAVPLQHCSF